MRKAISLWVVSLALCVQGAGVALAQQEVTVAGITFPGTITDRQWDVFIANVETRSEPALTLKMMVRGEAGSEETMIQSMRRGRLNMAAPSLAGATSLVPELAVLQLPFLFDTPEQMDWIYDTVLPGYFRTAFASRNVAFLHWIDSGWLGFYGPVPFNDPAHLRGIKLRTPPTDAARLTAEVLEADAIYVPYPEIVPALQTGLIEGGITSDYGFVTGGMAPEVRVFTITRHAYDTGMMLANGDWYAALSAENQAMLLTAYGDTRDFRRRSRAYTAGVLDTLEDTAGTQVATLSSDERRRWAEVTRPSHARLLDRLGPQAEALYNIIAEAKQRFDNAAPSGDKSMGNN